MNLKRCLKNSDGNKTFSGKSGFETFSKDFCFSESQYKTESIRYV